MEDVENEQLKVLKIVVERRVDEHIEDDTRADLTLILHCLKDLLCVISLTTS